MLRLNKTTFLNLYKDVEKKFIESFLLEHKLKPKATQIHGLQGYDRTKPTLVEELLKNRAIKKYLEELDEGKEEHLKTTLSARYLYNKRKNKNDKNKKEIVLQKPYNKIFFLYLGFEDEKDYIRNQASNLVSYTGYYYSYKQHEIQSYFLKIDYDRKPSFEKVEKQEYTVEERGFHDNDRDPIYSGYAYRLDGKLHIVLWNEEKNDKMKVILDSGDNPSGNHAMRGAILAISSLQGHSPMNLETLIVKDTHPLTAGDKLGIKRYLFLHRYNFRIKAEVLNLKAMKAKGADVHLIENFVGCWRTIRFDEDYQNLVVSILHVRADYRIICHTNQYKRENFNRQVCIPDITIINYFGSRTLCLTSYPNQGAKIISHMMLKIPARSRILVGGAILLVGKDGTYPTNRSIAMLRAPQLEALFDQNGKPIVEGLGQEVEIIPIQNIGNKIENDASFKKLYDLLIELEKESALPEGIGA